MTVLAAPRAMLAQACAQHKARAVISIVGWEDEPAPVIPARFAVLRLPISDIHCGSIWDAHTVQACVARGMTAPTLAHIDQALDFARGQEGPIVVHCTAGVSRSPAIVLAILADRMGPGHEADAVAALFAQGPSHPNPGIVALADTALGRNGALIDALEAHQAAQPTDPAPFSW